MHNSWVFKSPGVKESLRVFPRLCALIRSCRRVLSSWDHEWGVDFRAPTISLGSSIEVKPYEWELGTDILEL